VYRTIRRAHPVQPVAAIQSECSLWIRDPEQNGVLETCEQLGIGFVPWAPLGEGHLTGKIGAGTKLDPKSDLRSEFPRFSAETLAANGLVIGLLRQFVFSPKSRCAVNACLNGICSRLTKQSSS
jgi:aryl-alcohol dehydrogenase-like predicted oxidoreductase